MLAAHLESLKTGPVGSPLYDENGYLLSQELWSEQLADRLAQEEGVAPLTEKHWRVLNHIRERFFRLGALPNLRRVCRETELSRSEVYGLFGGCLSAWRIAGLPNPGEEARAYLT